jgi:hypothetical protein
MFGAWRGRIPAQAAFRLRLGMHWRPLSRLTSHLLDEQRLYTCTVAFNLQLNKLILAQSARQPYKEGWTLLPTLVNARKAVNEILLSRAFCCASIVHLNTLEGTHSKSPLRTELIYSRVHVIL